MLTLRWWSTPPSCSSPSPTCSWALEVLRGSRPQRYLSHFNSQLSWGRRLRMEPIVQNWGQKTAWIWSLPSSTTTQEWLPNFTWMKTSKRQSYTFWWGRRPKPELPCRRTWIGTSGRNVRSPASCWSRHGGCCQLTRKMWKAISKSSWPWPQMSKKLSLRTTSLLSTWKPNGWKQVCVANTVQPLGNGTEWFTTHVSCFMPQTKQQNSGARMIPRNWK